MTPGYPALMIGCHGIKVKLFNRFRNRLLSGSLFCDIRISVNIRVLIMNKHNATKQ